MLFMPFLVSGHVALFSSAAYWSLRIPAFLARQLEQANEFDQLVGSELAEQFLRHAIDLIVHFAQEFETGRRNLGPNHAPIAFVALLLNELQGLYSRQETGNIWVGGDHAVADGGTGEALRTSATQNAKDVVLRCRDAPVTGPSLKCPLQAVRSSH